jgi:hypothetical protein
MASTDPTGYLSIPPELTRGVSWKQPVRCASTANGTISTAFVNGQTVDGITLATGDRILLKDQTAGAANGIYTVNASGSPTRAFDMDQDLTTSVPAQETMGAIVYVIAGTTNGGTSWRCTNTTSPTLGTTALTFAAYASSAGTVTSVALTAPAEFSVSGSPVTGSGTLAITKANESANTVWAGPTSGSAAAPAFRALVAADIPAGVGAVHEILISDTPSTPLVFADLIQNEAQSDLVYAD